MPTTGTDAPVLAALEAMLSPHLTAEQAALIFEQGQEAVVFALLCLAKQLAQKSAVVPKAPDPSAPSGQIPPYAKSAPKGRKKPKGAKPGHPGHCRRVPTRTDRREEHTLDACPKCHGPVQRCRKSRTRIIEDIPADINPVVTEHTIPRYWCPQCRQTVEPVVTDALPGSTIGLRVVVLSAWLHYLLGTTSGRLHLKSCSEQHFLEIVLVPTGSEAFVLDADLQRGFVLQ
jgi:transposase